MKVYVVVYHDNSFYAAQECDRILGVFSTEEAAEKIAEQFRNGPDFYDGDCPDECYVDEYELDTSYYICDKDEDSAE